MSSFLLSILSGVQLSSVQDAQDSLRQSLALHSEASSEVNTFVPQYVLQADVLLMMLVKYIWLCNELQEQQAKVRMLVKTRMSQAQGLLKTFQVILN